MKDSFKVLTSIAFFSIFYLQAIPKAQDCGCNAALIQDKINASSKGFELLHSLQTLTENEYNEIKKNGSGGFQYGLIEGSADYGDFRKKLKEEIYSTELEMESQYDSMRYEARVNPIAYNYWSECMARCISKQVGLHLLMQNESINNVAIELKYVSPPGATTPLKYIIQIQHGDGSLGREEGEVLPGGSVPISVRRKCGSENGISQTLISAQGGGYSTGWLPPSKFYCGTPPPPIPLINKFEKNMVCIKGGTYEMGNSEYSEENKDEYPNHEVTVSDFCISKYEVTQLEWLNVMDYNPSIANPNCLDCPVDNITYNEIGIFINRINAKYKGFNYRLPTEEEWEYASRGGQGNSYKYAGSNNFEEVAWTASNSRNKSHVVGKLMQNNFKLFDMSGNVWEFCQNVFQYYPGSKYYPGKDENYRIVRGGSWVDGTAGSRISNRGAKQLETKESGIGFRIARNPK